MVQTIGSGKTEQEVQKLWFLGRQEIEQLRGQERLFVSEGDTLMEKAFGGLANANVQTVGPEIIFGKIYDAMGFCKIEEELFRHLVIARLSFPLSKLKTVQYLYRYQGIRLDENVIYRFLDKLSSGLKEKVEQINFSHTSRVLEGNIGVVFYDMTTLYFEASDEDELRKMGFSKDGKHSNPQIYLGLLVGLGGYPIGYDIFEGNIYEGHTLIPFIEKMTTKFNLDKPIVVADAGLLSGENIAALEEKEYEYIIGARVLNESEAVKQLILSRRLNEGETMRVKKADARSLIVSYSSTRAARDEANRRRGLKRLEKQIKSKRLTKASLNNRGYNKYLRIKGEVNVEIDYQKFEEDKVWDGLKGYITNTQLTDRQVIENYKNLWQIEKAFRMSKTDLRIRPIYHRLRPRIEAHVCIAFTAYSIYKELERVLKKEKSKLSLKTAAELTQNMYSITYTFPESMHTKTQLLKMDDQQAELYRIVQKTF